MAEIILLPKDIARFWMKVRRDEVTGCLLWTAGCNFDGYGMFSSHGRDIGAHRVSWMLAHGPIPAGRCVLHSCDTPPCVEERHLFLGSQTENIADMDRKGRRGVVRGNDHFSRRRPECLARGDRNGARAHPERLARGDRNGSRLYPERLWRGERNARAKITADAIREIRALALAGLSQTEIGRRFGVNQQNVSQIVLRRTWRHVD